MWMTRRIKFLSAVVFINVGEHVECRVWRVQKRQQAVLLRGSYLS